MAVIGTLGDIVFSTSADKVNTIDNAQWSSSASFSEHKRHLHEALLEFTGNDAETFSFDMYFSVFLGVDPIEEVTKLLLAKRAGAALPLYIGTKGYGTYRWVISDVVFDLKNYDNKGNLIEANANVTLRSYASR